MPRPTSTVVDAPLASQRHSCPPVVRSSALHFLHKISHVQLADFKKIDGVRYYVLNVYEKPSRRRLTGPSSQMRRLTEFQSTTTPAGVVPASRKPTFRAVKRFRDFEELRKQLQRSFSGAKTLGECSCCDAFTTFLSCRSMQPGLLTKLTKNEADRKLLLETFINQVIRLAVLQSGGSSHHQHQSTCTVKDLVPTVLEQFIRASHEQKTQRLADVSDMPTARSSLAA